MKVLFNTYPMAFHTPGGGEIQLLQYKNHLPEAGVEVKLLDQWNPKFLDADIVHFFSCMSGSLHFCAFIKSIGLPLVVSPNLWITEATKHQYPADEIRTMFVLADKVIGNSDMECDLLARVFNMPRERFTTVYNGVDDKFFEPVDSEIFRKHFGINGPFVLNVANIEPRKNQLALAKAMKRFPELKLVLIGHERNPEYAQQCYLEGGAQLQYLGPLPHDSELLRSAYVASELFALPSTLETPGLAALEAAAVGTRLVVTAEGCAREYFGEGAIYIDHSDSDNIAQGIALALAQPKDRLTSLYIKANFTWQRVIKNLVNIYQNQSEEHIEQRDSNGFFQIEKDAIGLFAWTKKQLTFRYREGVLSFNWRSIQNTEVDIYVDGVFACTAPVCEQWQPFNIQIKSALGKQECDIRLEVRRDQVVSSNGDMRELGVAIRDVL